MPKPKAPIPEALLVADQQNAGPITRFELRNGLKVIVRENAAIPLAAVLMRVATGSGAAEDGPRTIAALTARAILYEGASTTSSGTGRLHMIGGRIGVEATPTATIFDALVPSDSLDEALRVQAELLAHPRFDETWIQREVLALEREPSFDDPPTLGRRHFARLLSAETASATAPVGEPGSLRDRVVAFHRRTYRPERMTVVVAGNVQAFNVLESIQRGFGTFDREPEAAPTDEARDGKSSVERKDEAPAPPVPAQPNAQAEAAPGTEAARPDVPSAESFVYGSDRADSGLAIVTVGYRTEGLGHVEPPVLDLLTAALAAGRTSRLGRALQSPAIVTQVAAAQIVVQEAWVPAVQLVLDPKNLATAEGTLFREVDRFRREVMSDGELQRARNLAERRFYDRFATAEDAARTLLRFETQHGGVEAVSRYVTRLRGVSAAEVQQAAARLLVPSRAVVHELLPLAAPARTFTARSFRTAIDGWAAKAGEEISPASARPAEAVAPLDEGRSRGQQGDVDGAVYIPVPRPVRDFSTLNGPQAFVREDQSRPTVAVGFFFAGGRAAEQTSETGITELLLRTLVRGSKAHPGDRLLYQIEQLGGEVRLVNEPDFCGVVIEVLSRNAGQVVPLVIDMVENPTLDKNDVAREREGLLASQDLAKAPGWSRATALFWQGRYPAHPYGWLEFGTPATVGGLDEKKLQAYYERTVKGQFPLVGIAGDTEGSSLISNYVVDGFDRDESQPLVAPGLPAPDAPSQAVEQSGLPVSLQMVGFPAPVGGAELVDALDVAMAILGEPGGPVAERMREVTGLAEPVVLHVERRRLGSAILFGLASRPGQELKDRETALDVVSRVLSNPLPDELLAAGRAGAIRRKIARIQVHREALVAYVKAAAFRQLLDSIETYPDRVADIPELDVRKAAAEYLIPRRGGIGLVSGVR